MIDAYLGVKLDDGMEFLYSRLRDTRSYRWYSLPDFFIQVLWEGFVSGVLYALIALGFVLIFKASGIFNFAQGIMVVFAALTLVGLNEPSACQLMSWTVRAILSWR